MNELATGFATKKAAIDAGYRSRRKWFANFRVPLHGELPTVVKGESWNNHWPNITAMFEYPPEIRKAIYTTNAIESVNSVIRKVIRNRKIFPNESSAIKIVYLAINEAQKKWTMPIQHWNMALQQFAIKLEDRFPQHLLNHKKQPVTQSSLQARHKQHSTPTIFELSSPMESSK